MNPRFKLLFLVATVAVILVSCKKDEEPDTFGCLDVNAANYDGSVDWQDNSCKFLYVTEFEITYHEDKSWDDLNPLFSEADLVLRVGPDSLNTVSYISNTQLDADPDSAYGFTATEQFLLTNETWYWDLSNDNMVPLLESYEFMAGGSFNPVFSSNGSYVTSISSDGTTQFKIYYDIR
jgi:hypothetical protein